MKKRVVLILADGMRRDSLPACGNPYVDVFSAESAVWTNTMTVMPSSTLPCHMSLMHSVPPERHGVICNTFTPMVRPVDGLFEQLAAHGKRGAIFYGWGQLKDIYRPASPAVACCVASKWCASPKRVNEVLTRQTIDYLTSPEEDLDFVFLYLPWPDEAGHASGWMGETYLTAVHHSWDCVKQVADAVTEQDTVIVTADHGGHDRTHGHDIPEDMEIPLLLRGPDFPAGIRTEVASIMDIAPTICRILDIPTNGEWEGKSLL